MENRIQADFMVAGTLYKQRSSSLYAVSVGSQWDPGQWANFFDDATLQLSHPGV